MVVVVAVVVGRALATFVDVTVAMVVVAGARVVVVVVV